MPSSTFGGGGPMSSTLPRPFEIMYDDVLGHADLRVNDEALDVRVQGAVLDCTARRGETQSARGGR